MFASRYAFGIGKACIIIRQSAIEDGRDSAQDIGIFDSIGWKEYTGSSDLFLIIENPPTALPLRYPQPALNVKAPVYLLDGRDKVDSIILVKSRIKKAGLFFRSFDPEETSRLNPYEAIKNVAESYGIIITLLPNRFRDAASHNLRASFIAGLAEGMGKEILLLQLGDGPVAIDYRDMVKVCRRREDIVDAIAAFAPLITMAFQQQQAARQPLPSSLLQRLQLGASAAENEFRDLGAYFVQTDAYWRARRGEVRLVLGRKGSGKSALFSQVRDYHRQNRSNIVVDIKPEGYKLLKFKDDIVHLLDEVSFEIP
jgi:hypothetical protein